MAENININITGSPLELLEDINREVDNIANNYQRHLAIVETINEQSEEYLEILDEINENNLEINKNTKSRVKISKDLFDLEKKISKLVEIQSKHQKRINDGETEQLEVLKKINNELLELEETKLRLVNSGNSLSNDIETSLKENEQLKLIIEKLDTIVDEYDEVGEEGEKALKKTKKGTDENTESIGLWASALRTVGHGFKAVWNASKVWAKTDSDLSKVNKHLGLSNQSLGIYKQHIYDAAQTTNLYGVSIEKLNQLQTSYWEDVGRTIQFSVSTMGDIAKFSSVFGDDVMKTVASLDQYGLGSKMSFDLLERGAKLANKQGIDMVGASKQFQSNIRLATQHTFKRGLQELQEMTVNSMKLRMNMGEVSKLANKTMTPEGAIEVGAKLQVLGGGAAMAADPLSLLHESINDFSALGDRIDTMISGAMRFNRETGEINFGSGYDRMRFSAIADATGMDFNNLVEQAQMQIRRAEIGKSIDKYSSDIQDVLLSTAQFNDGRWQVKGASGEMEDIDKLGIDTLEYIRPQALDIKTIAKSSQGVQDTLDNIFAWMKGSLGNVINQTFGEGGYLSKAITSGQNWFADTQLGRSMGVPTRKKSVSVGSTLTGTSDYIEDEGTVIGGVGVLAGTAVAVKAGKAVRNRIVKRNARRAEEKAKQKLLREAEEKAAKETAEKAVAKTSSNIASNTANTATNKTVASASKKGLSKGVKRGTIIGGTIAAVAAIGYGVHRYSKRKKERENDDIPTTNQIDSNNVTPISNNNDSLLVKSDSEDIIVDEITTIRELLESRLQVKSNIEKPYDSNIDFEGLSAFHDNKNLDDIASYAQIGASTAGTVGRRMGLSTIGSVGTKLGKNLARGGAFSIGGTAVGIGRDLLGDKVKRNSNLDYGLVTAQGALAGAGLGSMLGPIGTAIGAGLGGISAVIEKSTKSRREKAVSKFESISNKMTNIAQMDSLEVLRQIGQSTYHIEEILLKQYGEVVSEKDMKKGVGEQISGFFNKIVTGVSVNDAVIKGNTITPIHPNDNLLVGTSDGPLFNNILPKATEFYGEKIKSNNRNFVGDNNINSTINSKIEISGTIKLDGGNNSANVNVRDLLNNPEFKKLLTQSLMNEMSRNHNGGRTVGDFNKYTII